MAYTKEQIEYLHDIGKMPDWAYYQQNGKTAEENYRIQKQKQEAEYRRRLYEESRRKEFEKELEEEIEKKAAATIEKVLDELLKDFNK